MKTAIKVLIFVALMCIYWAFGGLDDSKQFRRLHITITVVFIVGAIIALCEGNEIGILHPVSLRPLFVILGSLLMIGAFAAMIATRGEREKGDDAPNKSLQPTRESVFRRESRTLCLSLSYVADPSHHIGKRGRQRIRQITQGARFATLPDRQRLRAFTHPARRG